MIQPGHTLVYYEHPHYWKKSEVSIQFFSEIVNHLDRLASTVYAGNTQPELVFVHHSRGDRMGIGIGGQASTLLYVDPDLDPWYPISTLYPEGITKVLFPHPTEISNSRLLPYEVALQGLREWMEVGTMSPSIKWTDILP